MKVYRINWAEALSVLFIFTVQFAFYPGVTLAYEPSFFVDFSWFVIALMIFTNVCDTIGRILAKRFEVIPKKYFNKISLFRIIFIVTYMLTYEGVAENFFGSNAFIIINLMLFAISCGYLSTLGMKYGSDQSTVDQGMAGTIMGIHLTVGILIGSTIALIFLS
mmetsp:Transcript_86260/g.118937  ORF Transcript_86260/g.118937 Transcript_86260/m.118937 type:complete len:163 (-) Transcript_86260:51-539(-)